MGTWNGAGGGVHAGVRTVVRCLAEYRRLLLGDRDTTTTVAAGGGSSGGNGSGAAASAAATASVPSGGTPTVEVVAALRQVQGSLARSLEGLRLEQRRSRQQQAQKQRETAYMRERRAFAASHAASHALLG